MSKKERLTVFIGGGGGGSGRRASSNEREVDLSQKKKSARHFQAAPSRLSSPTPRICKEKGVPSRFSARVEAHDGWTRGKRGRNGADVLQRKKKKQTTTRVFFFPQQQAAAEKSIHHHRSFFSARSPLPLLLVLEDPEDLRVGLDEGRECVGEDSLHFGYGFFFSFF